MYVWQSASSNPSVRFSLSNLILKKKKKSKVQERLEPCATSAFIRRKREQNSDATILRKKRRHNHDYYIVFI